MLKLYARPNADSYTESIIFKTKYFESTNGNKDTQPMMEFKYRCKYSTLLFFTGRHRAFINLFRDGLTTEVLHPLWGQPAFITQTLVNTTTIPCAPQESDFIIGDFIFIGYGYDEFNVVTLIDITEDSLIIDTPLDISVGGVILPSFVGIVSGDINTTYSGENYAMCEINIEEIR